MIHNEYRWPDSLNRVSIDTFPLICLNIPNIQSLRTEALDYFSKSDQNLSIAVMEMTSLEEPSERYPDINNQIAWNESYRKLARVHGVNLFYLPQFKKGDAMAKYARLTAMHIPEYALRQNLEGSQVAIGVSIMAPQYDYLRQYLALINKELPVHNTLQQTCEYAESLCRKL